MAVSVWLSAVMLIVGLFIRLHTEEMPIFKENDE